MYTPVSYSDLPSIIPATQIWPSVFWSFRLNENKIALWILRQLVRTRRPWSPKSRCVVNIFTGKQVIYFSTQISEQLDREIAVESIRVNILMLSGWWLDWFLRCTFLGEIKSNGFYSVSILVLLHGWWLYSIIEASWRMLSLQRMKCSESLINR